MTDGPTRTNVPVPLPVTGSKGECVTTERKGKDHRRWASLSGDRRWSSKTSSRVKDADTVTPVTYTLLQKIVEVRDFWCSYVTLYGISYGLSGDFWTWVDSPDDRVHTVTRATTRRD